MTNLLNQFADNVQTNPKDLALSVEGEEFSYRELADLIIPVAGWIRTVCDQPNPQIGILTSRSLSAYIGILAATWSGAAYVPLNVNTPADYLNEILHAAQIDALIVDETGLAIIEAGHLKHLPEAVLSPVFVPQVAPLAKLAFGTELRDIPSSEPAQIVLSSVAYVMFTSGTTGKPKGIEVSLENILHLLTTLQNRYLYNSRDRLSQAFELTFDLSVFDIFMAFRSGSSLHVVPSHQLPVPARFIQQHKLTSWFSVPSLIGMLKQMSQLPNNAFPSLRLSLFCGEALPTESATCWQRAAPNSRIENLYGPTEATVACMLQDCSLPDSTTPGRGIIAIGQPFEGLTAAVLDAEGNFLPTGEIGELAIHGPQVTGGYLCNNELSAQRFPSLKHPLLGQSRWYLTGDLAYRDEAECFHFMGRIDNQVKLRGHRIELDEIEHHLREVSGCENAVAIFIDQEQICAQEIVGVVLPDTLDTGELRKLLSRRLPSYMVPKKIVVCDELPRNASGKLDRNALRRQITASRIGKP